MDTKISVVITSKNDNYGGNLSHRAKHCLINFINQFDEVIYVDWKSNNTPLHQEIINDLPQTGKFKSYIITKELIQKYSPQYLNYSIVEVLGRNIGIRRASNNWILVANIDGIIERFDVQKFNTNTLYTYPRREVPIDVHLKFKNKLNDEFISYLRKHKYTFALQKHVCMFDIPIWDPGDIWSLVVACGDFQFAHKDVWYKIKGFEESLGGRGFADSNLMKKGKIYTNIEKSPEPIDIYHLQHDNTKNQTPEEILPINDRDFSIINFLNTSNTEDWGWNNVQLNSLIK
jgi:hypothetical protein